MTIDNFSICSIIANILKGGIKMNPSSSSKNQLNDDDIDLFMEFIKNEFKRVPDELKPRDLVRIHSIIPLIPYLFQKDISLKVIEDYENNPDFYINKTGRSLLNKARSIAYKPQFSKVRNRSLYWFYVDFDAFCKAEVNSTCEEELERHANINELSLTRRRIPLKRIEGTWVIHVDDIDKYLLQVHEDFHEVV